MAESQCNKFPMELTDVDQDLANEIMSYFTGELTGYLQVGPEKYFLREKFRKMAAPIYNMPLRDSDVFVISFPRSGTTWTQEMVWLINSDLDYDGAAATILVERYAFIEMPSLFNDKLADKFRGIHKDNENVLKLLEIMTNTSLDYHINAPSPRYIKSHLPLSLLPPALLDTCRAVYVARDPRDAAVSFYHHNRLFTSEGYRGDFKTYWNYFYKGLVEYTPYFDHLKEAWAKRNHPNLLLLFYEDMVKDLTAAVRKVINFLGKQFTEEQIAKLVDHLTFENFKKNASVNEEYGLEEFSEYTNKNEEPFIRKGKSGGWRSYFDEEMTAQAQQWMTDNLKDTDFKFPC